MCTRLTTCSRFLHVVHGCGDQRNTQAVEFHLACIIAGVLTLPSTLSATPPYQSSSACKQSLRRSSRKYSSSPSHLRATQDMTLPLLKPVTAVDGSQLNEVAVPRGTEVIVSLRSLNRSKDYWGTDALEWKPERFLAPLPASLLDSHVPGIYSNM
jgi:hypothetical protein